MEQRFAIYALIAPAAALFATFFIAPFVYFFVISFWQVRSYRLSPDFTIANYMKAATSYVSIGLLTIGVASAVALLSVVLALIYTGIIRFKAGRFGPFLLYVPLITMFGGYLVKIYAWKTILGNEGILNTALLGLGLIEQPITALLYSPGAVLVTLLYFLLPFAIPADLRFDAWYHRYRVGGRSRSRRNRLATAQRHHHSALQARLDRSLHRLLFC